MDLRGYLHVVRRGWLLVVVCTLLGLGVGIGITVATTPVYRASAQLFVAADTGGDGTENGLAQGNNFVQDRVDSYTSIATSPRVTEAVIRKLGLPLTTTQLADKIAADAPANSVLLDVHVTDHDARTAVTLTNAVAVEFARAVEDTEQTGADGSSVVKLTIIHPATIPRSPIKPNKPRDVLLGLLAGVVLGLAVVIGRDLLDSSVTGADLDELGVPVLGVIPLDKRTPAEPIAFRGDPHGARAEAYRLLRANLQFIRVDRAPRVIAVTSAVAAEGKSTTALNLAASLAESNFRVCLVEADMRRPSMAKILGLVPDVGLTTALIGKVAPQDALQAAGPNLTVLTCGVVPPNPSELLGSEHARQLISELAAQFEFTIIDTAPVLPVADGAEVAALADATIVVYRAGKTSKDQAARSVLMLERIGERPVGAVLNMVTRRTGRYDYDGGYYYRQNRSPLRSGDGSGDPADEAEPGSTAEPEGPPVAAQLPGDSESDDPLRHQGRRHRRR